jgi:hypothetical protein
MLLVAGSCDCVLISSLADDVQWKSSAVVAMLERRVGDDQFRKLLQRLVSAAARQPPGGAPSALRRSLAGSGL